MTDRSPKCKLDLRPQEARALLRLLDQHMYDAPDYDRDRLARVRARVANGLGWMARKFGVEAVAADADEPRA